MSPFFSVLIGGILGGFALVTVATYLAYLPFYLFGIRSARTQIILASVVATIIFAINIYGAMNAKVSPAYPEMMDLITGTLSGLTGRWAYFVLQGALYVIGALLLIFTIRQWQSQKDR